MKPSDFVVLVGEAQDGLGEGNYKFCVKEFGDAQSYLRANSLDMMIARDKIRVIFQKQVYEIDVGGKVETPTQGMGHQQSFMVGVYDRNRANQLEAMVDAVREKQRKTSENWGLAKGSEDNC